MNATNTRNPEWGFYGTCKTNGHADPDAAWDQMMEILTDTDGRFRLEPEVARDLLDSAWGRHLANDCMGMEIVDVIEDLVLDRRWMKHTLEITKALVLARADAGKE